MVQAIKSSSILEQNRRHSHGGKRRAPSHTFHHHHRDLLHKHGHRRSQIIVYQQIFLRHCNAHMFYYPNQIPRKPNSLRSRLFLAETRLQHSEDSLNLWHRPVTIRRIPEHYLSDHLHHKLPNKTMPNDSRSWTIVVILPRERTIEKERSLPNDEDKPFHILRDRKQPLIYRSVWLV